MKNRVYLQDVTLRDGMHAVRHQLSVDRVQAIARALDKAGVDAIEVTHGDGLGGSTLTYGPSSNSDAEWIEAAAEVVENAALTALILPGIGTIRDLKEARDLGVTSLRVATHCTEADVSWEIITAAKEMGLDVAGFLMMSHLSPPEALAAEAKKMESYGADAVYVTDSAGRLTERGVRERVRAYREVLEPETQIGIHAHQNLSLAVANSLAALDEGAYRVDASLAGHGAGAGNTPIEPLVAVMEIEGWADNYDLYALQDAADDLVRPLHERPVQVDRETLTIGYAGVYSSFLRHAERIGERFGLDARDILMKAGERKLIGGQEDMLTDLALDMVAANEGETA